MLAGAGAGALIVGVIIASASHQSPASSIRPASSATTTGIATQRVSLPNTTTAAVRTTGHPIVATTSAHPVATPSAATPTVVRTVSVAPPQNTAAPVKAAPVKSVPAVANPGEGATARCNDGTYSFAAHHQGACSHHGGVAVFYK